MLAKVLNGLVTVLALIAYTIITSLDSVYVITSPLTQYTSVLFFVLACLSISVGVATMLITNPLISWFALPVNLVTNGLFFNLFKIMLSIEVRGADSGTIGYGSLFTIRRLWSPAELAVAFKSKLAELGFEGVVNPSEIRAYLVNCTTMEQTFNAAKAYVALKNQVSVIPSFDMPYWTKVALITVAVGFTALVAVYAWDSMTGFDILGRKLKASLDKTNATVVELQGIQAKDAMDLRNLTASLGEKLATTQETVVSGLDKMEAMRQATVKALSALDRINPALKPLLEEFGLREILEATTPEARQEATKHFKTMALILYTYATELQARIIRSDNNLRAITPCLNSPEGWLAATAEGAKKTLFNSPD